MASSLDTRQILSSAYDAATETFKTTTTITGINMNGVYDAVTNPNPDNLGIIITERDAAPDETNQTLRVSGVNAATVTALDVSLHDSAGAAIALGQAHMAASLPVTLADNQTKIPVDIQLAGTAIDGNSGVKSNGTVRVVLATDQPQLTNKLLVTPDANSSVNVTQLAGTAIDTNSGNKSAGTQRMVLATDQPNLTTPLNVNASQIGGVASNLNAGTTDTGTLRTTLSKDAVTPITGTLAFGSVGAAYADIVAAASVNRDAFIVAITNTLNTDCTVGYGASDFITLPSQTSITMDMGSNGRKWASGTAIAVKYTASAPSSGSIWVSLI